MTSEQLLTWVDRQIADYAPIDDSPGEIRNRFQRTLEARSGLGDTVFGFTIPAELRATAVPAIRDRLDAALARWSTFLANVDGGPGHFTRSMQAAGLAAPEARAVHRDPAIAVAVRALVVRLRETAAATALWRQHHWCEDDEHHAFAVAPPLPTLEAALASAAAGGFELPPAVEALYAELGGLWVRGDEEAGERAFDPDEEYFVLAPFERLFDDDRDRDDWFVLDVHPDYFRWVMVHVETGEVATANKLDRTPRVIAPSLVAYLEQLATSYGHSS